jgi:hypothetical protein
MKTVLNLFIAYILLALLFTGAVVAAFSIPNSAIERNVRHSVQQVTDDGKMFTAQVGQIQPFKLGIFSDCLILGIAYCADNNHPQQSAMSNRFMMVDNSPVQGAHAMLEPTGGESLKPVIYCRYWHGNQVIIRPLLCVTTLHGIRVINWICLTLLLLGLLVVMWQRVGRADALIVTVALAAVMVPSVPMCMNYVPTFYIALLASIVMLCWKTVTANWQYTVTAFFVIGACTSFLDLLTTPMVALAVPLVVYMSYRKPEKAWRTVIVLSLAWLLGYALLWATKWLLAALITGHAAWEDAKGAITQRTVGQHNEQDYMMWCLKSTGMLLLAVVSLTTAVTLTFAKSWQSILQHSWLLLVAMASFVWAFVLMEHTWQHLHFTWRTFVVLAIGVGLFWHHTIDLRQPFALFRNHKTSSEIPSH